MAQELFQKVAYIGLRNADGSFMLNVPLYVKVSELNKNGMTDTQEKVLHRISEVMIKDRRRKNCCVRIKKESRAKICSALCVLSENFFPLRRRLFLVGC